MRLLLLTMGSLLLLGCATSSYRQLAATRTDQALVYLIRERAEPTMWNLYVYLDGEKAASLSNNSSVAFNASPGQHKLKLDWPFLASSAKVEAPITLEAGKGYYFVVTGTSDITMGGTVTHTSESIQLYLVSEEKGKELLQKVASK